MENSSYGELFASESIRGERIHWKINWVIYPLLLLLSTVAVKFQGNQTAGRAGIALASVNLLYNGLLWYFIYRRRPVRILGYITVTLNVFSLSVYNYFDGLHNSPLLTATSAAILLYPVIMFLASLRMDRFLVVYTTVLCCTAMNLLYFHFHGSFSLDVTEADLSADWLSQGYRTVYLLVIGYLIYSVPRSMRRILARQEELMREKSFHQAKAERDPLTSLFNRYHLENSFGGCRERSRRTGIKYALVYIDLNDFKAINDTHGHDCGDFVLKSVGRDLMNTVRDEDIVARIGGDELVVLLPVKPNGKNLPFLAERISRAVAGVRTFRDVSLTVRASIGVALYPDHADTLEGLLDRADRAMYQIKKQKRHGVAFAEDYPVPDPAEPAAGED